MNHYNQQISFDYTFQPYHLRGVFHIPPRYRTIDVTSFDQMIKNQTLYPTFSKKNFDMPLPKMDYAKNRRNYKLLLLNMMLGKWLRKFMTSLFIKAEGERSENTSLSLSKRLFDYPKWVFTWSKDIKKYSSFLSWLLICWCDCLNNVKQSRLYIYQHISS